MAENRFSRNPPPIAGCIIPVRRVSFNGKSWQKLGCHRDNIGQKEAFLEKGIQPALVALLPGLSFSPARLGNEYDK
jgi:hypothetical protein